MMARIAMPSPRCYAHGPTRSAFHHIRTCLAPKQRPGERCTVPAHSAKDRPTSPILHPVSIDGMGASGEATVDQSTVAEPTLALAPAPSALLRRPWFLSRHRPVKGA